MSSAETRPLEVLLVDDNPADVRLTEEALDDSDVACRLSVARDGEEAMAFLRHEAPFEGAPRPGVVLLDLGLPRKDGCEVLAELKADPNLRAIPVVVLTGSRNEDDVVRVYNLQACSYLVKPLEPADVSRALGPVAA